MSTRALPSDPGGLLLAEGTDPGDRCSQVFEPSEFYQELEGRVAAARKYVAIWSPFLLTARRRPVDEIVVIDGEITYVAGPKALSAPPSTTEVVVALTGRRFPSESWITKGRSRSSPRTADHHYHVLPQKIVGRH